MSYLNDLSNKGLNELKSRIIDAINDGYIVGEEVSEIRHKVFNQNYFIIGYYQAEEWLKDNYGVFNAIETIQEYENMHFGEVNTDLGSSENVCNMLVYILGEELLNECDIVSDNWDKKVTEKRAKKIVKYFEAE